MHDGSTALDFLAEERTRGITIQSSCAHMEWSGHRLQLIDSPGHIDFSVEVERCVRVLDGVVVLLDAVAGVEAQTEAVWTQARRYELPAVVYVNKMDRLGADIDRAVKQVRSRLQVLPLVLQRPVMEDGQLLGVVDLLEMKKLRFKGDFGDVVECSDVLSSSPLYNECIEAREKLVENLAEKNDAVMDSFVSSEHVPASLLQSAVSDAVRSGEATAVLCGAALRNIGVQPLLDAIVSYLPSPDLRPGPLAHSSTTGDTSKLSCDPNAPLCAFVFKVVFDRNRGLLAFVRVYQGTISVRDGVRIQSCSGGSSRTARAHKLLQIDAQSLRETERVSAGNVCAIVGLKDVSTGDTISARSDRSALRLAGIEVPTPVFMCSVEAESTDQADALTEALDVLQKEDPSLQVSIDEDTGQTLLKGLGELHLDIVRQRLSSQFNIDVTFGRMSVSYRETITQPSRASRDYRGIVRAALSSASATVELTPSSGTGADTVNVVVDAPEGADPLMVEAAERAGRDGASRGALLGLPGYQFALKVSALVLAPDTTPEAVYAAVMKAVAAAFKEGAPALLEPIARLEMKCPPAKAGDVLADLNSRRRAEVVNVDMCSDPAVLECVVPIAELIGYANAVRSLTQGAAHYSMALVGYRLVPEHIQKTLISSV